MVLNEREKIQGDFKSVYVGLQESFETEVAKCSKRVEMDMLVVYINLISYNFSLILN